MQFSSSILDQIGNTPLVQLRIMGRDVAPTILLKMESMNPGGSVKDRIGISMIEAAERDGRIKPGDLIIEPTSGNTGIGLALAARLKGYRCLFVMTDKASQERVRYLKALGADVLIVSSAAKSSSPEYYFNTAQRLASEIPGAVMLNQYDNPANPEAHYKTTGPEIWKQTEGRITHFIAGIGTGGTISGTARYLKEQNPSIQVIAADPIGSSIKAFKEFGRLVEPLPYLIEGVGQERIPGNLDLNLVDDIINVGDKDAFMTARQLARLEGVFCGGSSGMNVVAALQVAKKCKPTDVIVAIICDTGERYLTKHHSDEWLAEKQLLPDDSPTVGLVLANKGRETSLPLLISVQRDSTVAQALQSMEQYGVSQIPVMDGELLVGNVRENKLMAAVIESRDMMSAPIEQCMESAPPVVGSHDDIESAIELLKEHTYVAVEEYQRVVGVITRHDVLRFL
ncbi:MAG: cysteine synthase [Candidatus Kapaibacterium sp.]|jgi:cystathionine beta-synthase